MNATPSDAIVLSPPLTDFTRAIPELAALKASAAAADVQVHTVDLNLRAFLDAISPEQLREAVSLAEARISGLTRRPALGFWEQQELIALTGGFAEGQAALESSGAALETFRDENRFFSRDYYTAAVKSIGASMRLLSGLTYPFELSASSITAPFSVYSAQAISRWTAVDPFRRVYDKVLADVQHSGAKALVVVISEPGQFLPAFAFAKHAREQRPDTLLVLAGPWVEQWCAVEHAASKALVLNAFDAVVTMDAEQVLTELLVNVKAEKLKPVHGVWFKEGLKTTGRAKAHAASDVEKLPVPDMSDLSLSDYPVPEPVLTYRASRGRHVSRQGLLFWGLSEKGAELRRALPAALVAEHLTVLQEKTSARFVQLVGDVLESSWVDAFASAYAERGVKLRWTAEVLLDDVITEDMAARWKAAGCVSVVLGVNEQRARLADVRVSGEALAHAGIAVQIAAVLGWPGESEDGAKEIINLLRNHHQEIDAFTVAEHNTPAQRASVGLPANMQALTQIGVDLPVYPEYQRAIAGGVRERLVGEVERVAQGYQLKRAPFAGSVGSAHTMFGFDKYGRRVFAQAGRPASNGPGRPLSEGDRIKISESAKLLWLPYQLSVFDEIAREEIELRDHDLVRRSRDVSADKTWSYSQREDLKLRAGHRTPHILAPGMVPTEITLGLADLLVMATEQFLPISQLVAKAPREMRDALKRQLATLHTHGAIVTEQQARGMQGQNGRQQQQNGGRQINNGQNGGRPNGGPSNGGPGSNNGGPGGDGAGRRRRRRRGRGGGNPARMNNGGSPPPM
jgi:hypothetical protein